MRYELWAELETEREAMRLSAREEVVQCEICLDRQKDIAFGCGLQVNDNGNNNVDINININIDIDIDLDSYIDISA